MDTTLTGSNPKRHQKKWSIPELLRLMREYELLEMNVSDIALAHQRNKTSILNMLQKEGIIDGWGEARGVRLE